MNNTGTSITFIENIEEIFNRLSSIQQTLNYLGFPIELYATPPSGNDLHNTYWLIWLVEDLSIGTAKLFYKASISMVLQDYKSDWSLENRFYNYFFNKAVNQDRLYSLRRQAFDKFRSDGIIPTKEEMELGYENDLEECRAECVIPEL